MAVSAASPNVDNYAILKGIVKFQKTGDGDFRDLGNCPAFELTPTVETLEHKSSRSGVSSVDRKIVLSKSLKARIVMEELTPDNLGIILLGDVTPSSPEYVIDIFTLSEVTGALRFVGTNDIGGKVQMDFPSVSFIPSGSINMISEEWASMEVTADVLVGPDGSFGQAMWNISGEVTTITV
jgi:hypothetical protein